MIRIGRAREYNQSPTHCFTAMKYIHYCITFCFLATAPHFSIYAASEDAKTLAIASRRQVGDIDHVNILLEVSGDLLVKSGSDEKPERQELGLSFRRDYDEKTLQLPTATEKTTLRGVRYYRDASATGKKGSMALHPTLGSENRLVGIEIVGGKETIFSPKGPVNLDELELVTAVGESLPLDQLLPDKPVKVGDSWRISDDTIALLLALEEVTTNSVRAVLNEVTPEFARLELAGKVEGKLFGAANQVTLKAKCRFDRRAAASIGSPCACSRIATSAWLRTALTPPYSYK